MQKIISKEGLQWKTSVHRSFKKMETKKHPRSKKDFQELDEKIKQKAAAAKSDLKQNEAERTAWATDAEAEKEKRYDSSSPDGEN